MNSKRSLLVLSIGALLASCTLCVSGLPQCHEVKASLERERSGIRLAAFPSSYVNEMDLEFCPRGPSCCNKETERVLGDWSKTEFVLRVQGHTQKVAGPLKLIALKLENFIEDLLTQSQKEEDDFFRKTYGIFYVENQAIFDRFWHEIRDYYSRGRTDLVDVTSSFFSELYQKMYQVMNAQYFFDEVYMSCVAENMNAVVPFNDTPKRLATSIRRSMVAMRALSKSLRDAIEVTVQLGDASEPSPSCYSSLQAMHNCPACMGLPYSKPCPTYCLDVMTSCISRHSNLQSLWDDFVNSTLNLLDNISGPFNVESVMKQKDISISDAIMDFQYKSSSASQKVAEICGAPRRMKRSSSSGSEEIPMTSFVFERPSEDSVSPTLFRQDSRLNRIIEEIRGVLSSTNGFWKSLPAKLCEENSGNTASENCWNGIGGESTSASSSRFPVKQEAEDGNTTYDDEESEEEIVPNIFHEKKFRLQSVLNQVKLATGGQDVEWFDQESDFEDRYQLSNAGSGDFMGSGGDILTGEMFSGDGGLDEVFSSGNGGLLDENEDDDNKWTHWNPFSTPSTTEDSTVEMGLDIVEVSSSILRVSNVATVCLELLIATLVI